MPKSKIEFTGVIHKAPDMDNYFIPIENKSFKQFDVEEVFGKKRLLAKIWYNDVLYRGLLTRYNGEYNLMLNKEVREKVGKKPGDTIKIKIEEDLEERKVEMPKQLSDFFNKEKALKTIFDKLSYTHQKEYAIWLSSAKREETRQNRLIKFKDMLLKSKK